MAVNLQRFVITQNIVIAAGAVAAVVAGEPGTGGAAGYGNSSIGSGAEEWATSYIAGTTIVLDSGTPSALYTALNTASAIRAYVPGQDDVGHAAISN